MSTDDGFGQSNETAHREVEFRSVTPGKTRYSDLLNLEGWGVEERSSTAKNGLKFLEYSISGYKSVRVCVVDEILRSIDVELPDGVSEAQTVFHFNLGEQVSQVAQLNGSLVGLPVERKWKPKFYSAGKVVLFVDDSGNYPVVKLMRFYSAFDREALQQLKQGLEALEESRLDDAIRFFEAAIKIESQLAVAYKERGDAFVRKGQFPAAILSYESAVEHYPRYDQAFTHWGNALYQFGKQATALSLFQNAIDLNPDNADAHNSLAWMLATNREVRFRDGKQAVEHALLACKLTNWKAHYCLDTLAAAHAENGDFKQAVAYIEQAKKIAPNSEQSYLDDCLKLYKTQIPYRE